LAGHRLKYTMLFVQQTAMQCMAARAAWQHLLLAIYIG